MKKKDTRWHKHSRSLDNMAVQPPIFYSINTMLPQQDKECWDNVNVFAPLAPEAKVEVSSGGKHNRISIDSCTTNEKSAVVESHRGAMPANDGHSRQLSVHFPPESSIITAVHIRPRTYRLDVETLYYSSKDIRHFKAEYKRYLYVRALARETMGTRRQRHHDNSFWRTKVHRRWHGSSSPSTMRNHCDDEAGNAVDSAWEPLNDVGSVLVPFSDKDDETVQSECAVVESTWHDDNDQGVNAVSSVEVGSCESKDRVPQSAGVLSSAINVAQKAVTLLNGPASSTNSASGAKSTSLYLVDTMYLF